MLIYCTCFIIVSSLSLLNLHLLFCCVSSIFALIWLIFIGFFFFAAIRRDSVSFFRLYNFSTLSFKQSIQLLFFRFLFSRFSMFRYLCCNRCCCFKLSFLALFSIFLEFLNRCINEIFNADKSFSSSSLFSWYILFVCILSRVLSVVHRPQFPVLWSIRLSFSLVHFKNGPVKLFIPLIRFLLLRLISRRCLVLRYFFLLFHSFLFLMVFAYTIPRYLWLSFFQMYYYYYYKLLFEFFTPAFAEGFSLEFEWRKVSSRHPGLFTVFWPISTML